MKTAVAVAVILVVALLGAWAGPRIYRSAIPAVSRSGFDVPFTTVKRGDVVFSVVARGELAGGNSEMLTAPMAGGNEMAITMLRAPGEVIREGDVVAQFDTTEQTFRLREAESDLAEAEQQVIQAKAEAEAKEEEDRYALAQAKSELELAELESRRNPLLAPIVARENTLAVEAAKDKLRQFERDSASRKATSVASIAIQDAARNKAKVKAETAQKNIDSMTLRAHSAGYVNVQANMSSDFMFQGMQLPALQVGDTVRAGMAVAQIPDLKSWEATARIGELDRGHLAEKQPARIEVIALPGRRYEGRVKNIGGTTGPPWDRRFECKISVDNPSPELRPGMSARIVINTETMRDVLWLPAQAVFEDGSRVFVYRREGASFVPRDVKLERRSESQVVVSGLAEGTQVALSNPEQARQKGGASKGALQAISK